MMSGLILAADASRAFPPPLESYGDSEIAGIWNVLHHRIGQEPLNFWATLIFLGAIVHTFFANRFLHWSHLLEERRRSEMKGPGIVARALHFLGEVEVIFGFWCLPLFILLAVRLDWKSAVNYF